MTITAEPDSLDEASANQGRRAKTDGEPAQGLSPLVNGRRPSTDVDQDRLQSFLRVSPSQQASALGGLVQRRRLGSKSSNAGGAGEGRLHTRTGNAAGQQSEEPKVPVGNLSGQFTLGSQG